MKEISEKTQKLINRQSICFQESIMPELAANGIEISTWDQLSADEKKYVTKNYTVLQVRSYRRNI
jgi:polyphosphate kinase